MQASSDASVAKPKTLLVLNLGTQTLTDRDVGEKSYKPIPLEHCAPISRKSAVPKTTRHHTILPILRESKPMHSQAQFSMPVISVLKPPSTDSLQG